MFILNRIQVNNRMWDFGVRSGRTRITESCIFILRWTSVGPYSRRLSLTNTKRISVIKPKNLSSDNK